MIDYELFLGTSFPQSIRELKADAKPQWGSMNAEEMLQHLRLGIRMSKENQEGSISTSDEKLPVFKRFLMSDKPFGKNLNRPSFFDQPVQDMEFEELKKQLLQELEQLLHFLEQQPEHTSVHDSFGVLNAEEWKHLHYKHFRHHLTQFGLIE